MLKGTQTNLFGLGSLLIYFMFSGQMVTLLMKVNNNKKKCNQSHYPQNKKILERKNSGIIL
jgi:hypothetical protein